MPRPSEALDDPLPPEASDPIESSDTPRRSIGCNTWKDEYVLLLWSLPMVAAFVPGLRDFIKQGFEVLTNNVPPWYVNVWGIIAAGIFGVNRIANLAELHIRTRNAGPKDNGDD